MARIYFRKFWKHVIQIPLTVHLEDIFRYLMSCMKLIPAVIEHYQLVTIAYIYVRFFERNKTSLEQFQWSECRQTEYTEYLSSEW